MVWAALRPDTEGVSQLPAGPWCVFRCMLTASANDNDPLRHGDEGVEGLMWKREDDGGDSENGQAQKSASEG
jgi:hypothetical protein